MSLRTSILAIALFALSCVALAPTDASASFSFGRTHPFAARTFVNHVIGGINHIPGCGRVGCNMKW